MQGIQAILVFYTVFGPTANETAGERRRMQERFFASAKDIRLMRTIRAAPRKAPLPAHGGKPVRGLNSRCLIVLSGTRIGTGCRLSGGVARVQSGLKEHR